MISKSVRESLQAAGQSVSIRDKVRQANTPLLPRWRYPLSLRKFIRALPPGRHMQKVLPLDLLQRKFDDFINNPVPQFMKFRLHGTEYGKSNFEIYILNEKGQLELSRSEDMGHLEVPLPVVPDPDFHFDDLNSDLITVKVVPAQPSPTIEIAVRFETGGEELKINKLPNVDFRGLSLALKLEFGASGNKLDLFGWLGEIDAAVEKANVIYDSLNGDYSITMTFKGDTFYASGGDAARARKALKEKLAKEFIIPDANVDVLNVPDGYVARKIEGEIFDKVFEALTETPEVGEETLRGLLNRTLTTLLVGGDFHVMSVATTERAVTIDYILPFGQLEPFPETPQPPLKRGRLEKIEHIIVLMMENRSFDHMLGYLSKHAGRTDIDGLRGGEKNPYKGLDYFSSPLPGTVFDPGPCHEHECIVNQVNGGKMDGFVADYAERAKAKGKDPGQVMGYHVAAQVPVYDALAREFLVCQRWFAAHPGPTFPNRFYTVTGRLNRDASGRWEFDNPHGRGFVPVATKTIFDHLTSQKLSWNYYEHGYCFLRLFERYTFDNSHIVDINHPENGFFAKAKIGKLPAVSFIDPDFINVPPGNDDQPPADIAAGQNLIGRVVNAVMNGAGWEQSLLIITYDEHGGFFDHVPPPQAPVVSSIDRYGVRLPAFVVSPWVQRGGVTDVVFDHTSILKTIARCFLNTRPPDMGERMAAANDLSMVLQPVKRTDKAAIPVPPAPPRALARRGDLPSEGPRDFRELLRSVRSRYPMHN